MVCERTAPGLREATAAIMDYGPGRNNEIGGVWQLATGDRAALAGVK